jgi:VWFA-related protein
MAHLKIRRSVVSLSAVLLCVVAHAIGSRAQTQTTPARDKPEDVVRVETELVQTDVSVFDKSGKFVGGLAREQFEVKVDGQVVPVNFFERVESGIQHEDAARGTGASAAEAPGATVSAAARARGRTVVFFLDDLHLSLDSLGRTRAALALFVEREMTTRDLVAFVTSSGQLGFLQQLTDSKVMLRAAITRLRHFPYVVRDTEQPPMPEYVAVQIIRGNREATDFYVDEILKRSVTKGNAAHNRRAVAEMVRNRANQIVNGVEFVTRNSFGSLENLLRTLGRVGGRKLVFFFSDGFYLDSKTEVGAANTGLRRVIDAAARTGSVVYTIDTRGLFSLQADATGERPMDPQGRLDRASVGESLASQDGLASLAADTGGRFLANQNYFDRWVTRTLEETSNYYRLAWRPEEEGQKGGKFRRVEVSVVGRPELTVRLQRGYVPGGAKESADVVAVKVSLEEVAGAKSAGAELREAFASPVAKTSLPTVLSTSFVDVPGSGLVLTSSVQVATDDLNYGTDARQAADVDIVGGIWNEQGKQAGNFKTRLGVPALAGGARGPSGVIYNHRTLLAPGLYHIKVAARDARAGLVGSAAQWIEIPDLSKRHLALSSLHLGSYPVGGAKAGEDPQFQFSVDRRFARSARLDFLAFIYNAARTSASTPVDLSVRIQVLRDNRAVVSAPARKLVPDAAADFARISVTGAVSLGQLPAGQYEIEVTVDDNLSKTSATQRVAFEIQ